MRKSVLNLVLLNPDLSVFASDQDPQGFHSEKSYKWNAAGQQDNVLHKI